VAAPTRSYRDSAWTAADLLETARKLTRAGADPTARQFGYFVDTWIARWFPFLWGNGGDVFDSANDPKAFTFISRETEQTMQWLVDLRFQHLVSPQPVDLTGTTGLNLFRAGRVAMLQENMSLIPQMDAVSGLQWDAVPVARGPRGRFTRVAGAGLGIHPGSKNKEGGWAYLKFHGTPEAWSLARGQKFTIPPTKSAGAVALEGVAPETRRLWLDTLEYGRTQALHLKWTQLMEGDGARRLYTQALNGEVSVQAALDQIRRHAETVLP
jgi:multiple sugar transport system substrate-binding protein